MGRFGRFLHSDPARRAAAIAVAAVLLLVTLSGAVWAVSGTQKNKPVAKAATYTISLTPKEGQPAVEKSVSWTVGQAYVTASCSAVYGDPEYPDHPDEISIYWNGVVWNTGSEPMGVVDESGGTFWLAPGMGTADAAPSGPGGIIWWGNYPGPSSALETLAFLTPGRPSASGTWAWMAYVDESTSTAICVFSLQMRG